MLFEIDRGILLVLAVAKLQDAGLLEKERQSACRRQSFGLEKLACSPACLSLIPRC